MKLLHKNHSSRLAEIAAPNRVEIDTTGDRPASVIATVPGRAVGPGRIVSVHQGADGAAKRIEDSHLHLAGRWHFELNCRRRVERVGVILRQCKSFRRSQVDFQGAGVIEDAFEVDLTQPVVVAADCHLFIDEFVALRSHRGAVPWHKSDFLEAFTVAAFFDIEAVVVGFGEPAQMHVASLDLGGEGGQLDRGDGVYR